MESVERHDNVVDVALQALLADYREAKAEKRLILQAIFALTALLAGAAGIIGSAASDKNTLPLALLAPLASGSVWVFAALFVYVSDLTVYLAVIERRISSLVPLSPPVLQSELLWDSMWLRLPTALLPRSRFGALIGLGTIIVLATVIIVALLPLGTTSLALASWWYLLDEPLRGVLMNTYVVFVIAVDAFSVALWVAIPFIMKRRYRQYSLAHGFEEVMPEPRGRVGSKTRQIDGHTTAPVVDKDETTVPVVRRRE